VHAEKDRTTLEVTLREGRNRQIRRMLASLGFPVKKLERVAMGPLKLKGVARGEWRELSKAEVDRLRRAVPGLSRGARSGGGGGKGRRR
jgi:16S rRNA U516 pseudouridylate synthase RsuA-like enzyme